MLHFGLVGSLQSVLRVHWTQALVAGLHLGEEAVQSLSTLHVPVVARGTQEEFLQSKTLPPVGGQSSVFRHSTQRASAVVEVRQNAPSSEVAQSASAAHAGRSPGTHFLEAASQYPLGQRASVVQPRPGHCAA